MGKLLRSNGWSLLAMMVVTGGASCTADIAPSSNEKEVAGQHVRWSVRLPGNAGIYNEGLIGLPVVNDRVLFHSTMFTNETHEDNRIHALDISTGKLEWTFPTEFNPDEPYYFEGRPYVNEDILVTKMSAFEPYSYHDRILLMNVNSGLKQKIIHMPRSVSRFSCRDVVGLGTNAWFFQEDDHSSHLYKITLPSGDTARIVSLQSASEDGRLEVTNRELQVEYYEGQRVLNVGVLDNQVEHAELQLLVINADTGEIIFRRVVNRDQNFIINAVVMRGKQLLYTCGRFAGCVTIPGNQELWQYDAGGSVDRIIPGLFVHDSIVLVWGHSGYSALDLISGNRLYENELACVSVSGSTHGFIVLRSDGKVSVINQNTGTEITRLSVTSKADRHGFSYSCKPGVSNDNLFLFGEYNAYCFDLKNILP